MPTAHIVYVCYEKNELLPNLRTPFITVKFFATRVSLKMATATPITAGRISSLFCQRHPLPPAYPE